MAKRHSISIYIQDGVWMSHHSDPAIMEAFDTDTLPTAFNSEMGMVEVIKRLQEKNPGARIRFDPTRAFGAVTWERK